MIHAKCGLKKHNLSTILTSKGTQVESCGFANFKDIAKFIHVDRMWIQAASWCIELASSTNTKKKPKKLPGCSL